MTDGGNQGSEVMNTAEEDTSDDNPEKNGYPAEHGCGNRAGYGSRTGNRCEVVAQYNTL